MLKRTALWLAIALVSLWTFPGLAAIPKSMIMTTQIISSEGGRNVTADATIYYMDMKFRTEVSSNMQSTGSVKVNNKATVIMDAKAKTGYLIDDRNRTAIKIDEAQVEQMTGSSGSAGSFTNPSEFLTDPAKVKSELQKQGGKQIGKEKLLGYNCTIWQIAQTVKIPPARGSNAAPTSDNIIVKLWLADEVSIPLKAEVTSAKRGKIASMTTKKIQVNVPVKGSMFDIPSGYKITTLADMFQTPGKTPAKRP